MRHNLYDLYELYENIFVTKFFYKGVGSIFSWIDENIIDKSNAKISEFTVYLSNQLTNYKSVITFLYFTFFKTWNFNQIKSFISNQIKFLIKQLL